MYVRTSDRYYTGTDFNSERSLFSIPQIPNPMLTFLGIVGVLPCQLYHLPISYQSRIKALG